MENNIDEHSQYSFAPGYNTTADPAYYNYTLGNISFGAGTGPNMGITLIKVNGIWEYHNNGNPDYGLTASNNVSINDGEAFPDNGSKNFIISNNSSFNSSSNYAYRFGNTIGSYTTPSEGVQIYNNLAVNSYYKGFGFIGTPNSCTVQNNNSYTAPTPFSIPGNCTPQTGNISINPTLMGTGSNQCIVYVPGGFSNGVNSANGYNPLLGGQKSSMAGKGKNGADIGANVVYAYGGGFGAVPSITSTKLWCQGAQGQNSETRSNCKAGGQFAGCGAIVTGINDDASFPTSACVNVHKRLNVGVNGCPIP